LDTYTKLFEYKTKLESFIESLTNVAIGCIVALISQLIIFPFFDIEVSFSDNLLIGFKK